MDQRLATLALSILSGIAGCAQDRPQPSEAGQAHESPDGVPWGEAVGGLRLSVQTPNTRYTHEEPMRFTIRVRNVSTGPLRER